MERNNKKNYPFRMIISFMMLLFAICLIMNVLFCSTYNLYELSDVAAVETQTISEGIAANGDGDNTSCLKIHPIPAAAAISNGFGLFFPVILFLCFLLNAFILLPDKWTLINQKVRLDN